MFYYKMKNVLLIFICHDINISIDLINTYDHAYVMLVGKFSNNIITTCHQYPKIIITENLPINIEDEKKLLTFTAWYSIVKNNLFTNYEYLCLFEYDVIIQENFIDNLNGICNSCEEYDVISFIKDKRNFLSDVDSKILSKYTSTKLNRKIDWYCTTNHCVKYDVLKNFVNYYIGICFNIKNDDYEKLSWYHERIFYLFTKDTNLKTTFMEGVTHLFKNSHASTINS